MSRRRPIRAWLGTRVAADPAELLGPRGLTDEVLRGEDLEPDDPGSSAAPEDAGGDAFYRSLLTDARLSRIEAVVAARLSSATVVLDRLLDPHNVAAALRTAEGLGLLRVHVVPHEEAALVAHRRVTQDAHKWLDVLEHPSGSSAARALRAQGFAVYAGHLDEAALPLHDVPVAGPVALLFGNEHEGPSAETLAACTGMFRIPMAGFSQSFNVSVAAAIALARVTSARRAALGRPGDLDDEARAALRSRYLRLAAKLARRLRSPPP